MKFGISTFDRHEVGGGGPGAAAVVGGALEDAAVVVPARVVLRPALPEQALGGLAGVDTVGIDRWVDRRSADLCRGTTPGELSPRCVALVPGRVETRILDAAESRGVL